MASVLEVTGLDGGYGKIQVLRGISLEVRAGEVVTIIGANGAGKTTTLKAIAGLVRPRRGKIVFRGKDITRLPAHEVARLGLVLVPEGRQTFASLTVLDNLLIGTYGRGSREGPSVEEALEYVFSLFPVLKEKRSQQAGSLSGGQQQMLVIGRALMSNPTLLMCDEPSLGLAPMVVEEIFGVIQNLRERVPVLLVEQNAQAALRISNRGYVMAEGQVVLTGDSQLLLKDDKVKRLYLGAAS